ncbi:hypothetical protein D9M68_851260 [compost metagenome]
MGQAELLDAVQVFLACAAFDHPQLPGDQGVPHLMLGFAVVDKTAFIRLPSHVLRALHRCLLLGLLLLCWTMDIAGAVSMQPVKQA